MATEKGEQERNFEDTPAGWYGRWRMELDAAKRNREKFDREGAETIRRFLDRRENHDKESMRVNVYTSNVQTQECMLFGKTPAADVSRRFDDAQDEGARVASKMLKRIVNTDIGRDSDTYVAAIEYALSDFLRPGLGVARLRYDVDFDETPGEPAKTDDEGNELAPEVPATPRKNGETEKVHKEYVHWRDYRWSPCRTWHDMRWQAFCARLSREECIKKFGEKLGGRIPLQKGAKEDGGDPSPGETDALKSDPWSRAEIWEIWDKERRCVWFWARGMRRMIVPEGVEANPNGSIPDPLELDGFWCNPRPLVANLTTDSFMPRSDYALVQDLYRRIDDLSTRIDRITRAMRVVGVYDKTNSALQRLVRETTEGEMIAVDNWAKMVEKGGIKGAFEMLPLDTVVGVLDKLRELLIETKGLADEISGFADIVRGQQQGGETATTSAIEAKFASVRMQRRQDEVARFASELKALEAEIVCKHFDDQTIIDRSNIMRTADAKLVQQGLQVLRDQFIEYRIEVKPDAIALTDWGMKRTEAVEVLQTLGGYIQGMIPFLQMMGSQGPQAAQAAVSFVIDSARTLIASTRGGADLEPIFNDFVNQVKAIAAQAAANPPQPQPDPKLMAAQVKAQAEGVKARAGIAQSQIDGQVHVAKAAMDLKVAQAQHGMDMQRLEAQQRNDAMRAVSATVAPTGGAA